MLRVTLPAVRLVGVAVPRLVRRSSFLIWKVDSSGGWSWRKRMGASTWLSMWTLISS